MADEDREIVEETDASTEDTETTPEEEHEEEVEETASEETDESDDTDDVEVHESEADYLKQFDLPGNPQSLDDAFEAAKTTATELERLRGDEVNRRSQPEPQPKTEPSGDGFFTRNLMAAAVKDLSGRGQFQNDEATKGYNQMANVVDTAINPFIKQVEDTLNFFAGHMQKMTEHSREQSWARFDHKKLISRDKLNPIMDGKGLLDYNQAFLEYAMSNDQSLLGKITQRAEQRGQERAKKGKLKRFQTPRRSKPAGKSGKAYKGYINKFNELDMERLDRLPIAKKKEIVDAWHDDIVNPAA